MRLKIEMEATVRILSQSELIVREYKDKNTGEKKTIKTMLFRLSDGIDTFLGEITGDRAEKFPRLDPKYEYRVRCSMVVRDWNSQQTGEAMQATTIYVDKINMK